MVPGTPSHSVSILSLPLSEQLLWPLGDPCGATTTACGLRTMLRWIFHTFCRLSSPPHLGALRLAHGLFSALGARW